MASELMLATIIGGTIAIAGGFMAQRYLHVLEIRTRHHEDLSEHAIEPWIEHVRSRASQLLGNFEGFVGVTRKDSGYLFWQGAWFGSMFPPDTPLWAQGLKHWNAEYAAWLKVEDEQKALADLALEIVVPIEQALPDPPEGIHWEQRTAFGEDGARRAAAARIWRDYWDALWQEEQGGENARTVFATWLLQYTHWRGSPSGGQGEIRDAILPLMFSEAMQAKLNRFQERAEAVTALLGEHERKLHRLTHDRNLRGRCDYCPRFWPWLAKRSM